MPSRRRPATPDDTAGQAALEYQRWLGTRIKELRTVAQLNQDDFSYVAGIPRSYVGLVEHGKRDLKISTLRRIALAFGLEVHELLDPQFVLNAEGLRHALQS